MSQSKQSQLKVYNTLTRHLDDFQPIHPGRVNMFVCGPTVYDVSHIGHGKSYVAYDIIARYLRKKGYSVFFVLNITDIDDKIINRAKETKEDPLKLSERYSQAFYKDMKDLHVDSVNLYAKASDYIPEIINQIKGLVDKGIAYKITGGVYFDISKFPEYGKLSRQNLEQLTEWIQIPKNRTLATLFSGRARSRERLPGTVHGARDDQAGTSKTPR